MQDQQLKRLIPMAVQAAVQAGREIIGVYESGDLEIQTKADESPLTRADRLAHEVISNALRPSAIPVLSEEGRDIDYAERKDWVRLWIVDPLDGTKEFIKQNGEFTVNIALIQDQRPILGIIYVPVSKVLYWAGQGLGSWRCQLEGQLETQDLDRLQARSERLPCEQRSDPQGLVIVGSRSHAGPDLEAFIQEMRGKHEQVDFISTGSSLKICRVAEGSADIYPRFGPTMEWDTAAGQAIVEIAGKSMLDLKTGLAIKYNREQLRNPWFIVR